LKHAEVMPRMLGYCFTELTTL